jgi:hypothetical protein
MTARALTPTAKRDVIEALFAAWCAKPEQRLGQLIVNATTSTGTWRLFYAEDADLVADITEFASRVTERP